MTDETKVQTPEVKTRESRSESSQPSPIKDGITHTIQNTGDVFGTIVKTVSDGITSAAKGTGKAGASVLEAVSNVVRTAVRGSLGVGSDLVVGTKAIVVGVFRGTGEKEEAALKTLSHTARTIIRQTADNNGDVGAAATGLVAGAVASAKQIGVDPAKVASAAGSAAIEEADRISAVAGEKVRSALKKDASRTSAVLPEALKK